MAGSAAGPAVVAASVVWRALVVVAGLRVYWLLGVTWTVDSASDDASAPPQPEELLRVQRGFQ